MYICHLFHLVKRENGYFIRGFELYIFSLHEMK